MFASLVVASQGPNVQPWLAIVQKDKTRQTKRATTLNVEDAGSSMHRYCTHIKKRNGEHSISD